MISSTLFISGRSQALLRQPFYFTSFFRITRAFTESRDEASSLPVEKARSTAEEFNKHAKEMADSVAHNAKEAFESAKEAVVGESEHDKEKFKEKVEKGKYDKMGED